MPRRPEIYGNLLKAKIANNESKCWLVNTGWTGGPYGEGKRMPIQATRTLLAAALTGEIFKEKFRRDKNFGFEIPMFVEGVNSELLDPRKTWKNPEKYDIQARKLIDMFIGNFEQYIDHVDDSIKAIVLR